MAQPPTSQEKTTSLAPRSVFQECIADAKAERMSLDLAFRWQRPAPWCLLRCGGLLRWLFFLGVSKSLNGFNVDSLG